MCVFVEIVYNCIIPYSYIFIGQGNKQNFIDFVFKTEHFEFNNAKNAMDK